MATDAPAIEMQGILVPAESYNPDLFFKLTRRQTGTERAAAFAGLAGNDPLSLRKTGIISAIRLRFKGSLVVTPGTGTVATTARWPYDLFRKVKFQANGQSNLCNCSGWKLKAREVMGRGDLSDRGVAQGIGGASPGTSRNQGTLSMASESWGVGQNVSAIAGGTYPVDIEVLVPVAYDPLTLIGAIFAQTSATDLLLSVDWASQGDLFVLAGNATVALTGTLEVVPTRYTIPEVNGGIVVPDLSVFHSLIESRYTALANGDNRVPLPGAGLGRQLMRMFFQLWNGATPAPLALNDTNFGQLGYVFGQNDMPELYPNGGHLREANEALFNSDLGGFQGIGVLDFAKEWALRDSIDEGAATELGLLVNVGSAVTLANAGVEFVQETVFGGAAAA